MNKDKAAHAQPFRAGAFAAQQSKEPAKSLEIRAIGEGGSKFFPGRRVTAWVLKKTSKGKIPAGGIQEIHSNASKQG